MTYNKKLFLVSRAFSLPEKDSEKEGKNYSDDFWITWLEANELKQLDIVKTLPFIKNIKDLMRIEDKSLQHIVASQLNSYLVDLASLMHVSEEEKCVELTPSLEQKIIEDVVMTDEVHEAMKDAVDDEEKLRVVAQDVFQKLKESVK